ncbi:MAG: GNAT family N-acetyltransferase [Chloroflexota bacterium]
MTEAAIEIRAATIADYARANEVFAETFAFHRQAVPWMFRDTADPPPGMSFIKELLAGDSGAFFIAEHRSRVVGYLTIRLSPLVEQPYLVLRQPAIVDNLGVLQEWQRHGIGQKLMHAAEEWARSKGATHVHLNVWEFNYGAMALYDSLGYMTASRSMYKQL